MIGTEIVIGIGIDHETMIGTGIDVRMMIGGMNVETTTGTETTIGPVILTPGIRGFSEMMTDESSQARR